jgi:hypothetical protein
LCLQRTEHNYVQLLCTIQIAREVLSYFVKSVVKYVCGVDCQGNSVFREAQTHEAQAVNKVYHATVVCRDWNEDRPELFNPFRQWGFSGSFDGGPNSST